MKPVKKWTFEPENIREYRKAQKITLDEVAEATGLDPGNLSKIERGIRKARADTICKLCSAFGVQPGFFFKSHIK